MKVQVYTSPRAVNVGLSGQWDSAQSEYCFAQSGGRSEGARTATPPRTLNRGSQRRVACFCNPRSVRALDVLGVHVGS